MNKSTGSFRRLFGYLRRYWLGYVGGGIFMVSLEAVFQVMVALLLKHLVDATLAGDAGLLVRGLIQMGLALLVLGGILPWSIRTCMRAVALAAQDMRQDLFDHIQTLPISYHEKVHSGDTVSRITNDISAAKQAFGNTLLFFIGGIVSALVCAASISLISWKLCLTALALGILPLLFNRYTARPLRDSSTAVQVSLAGLNTRLKDLLAGMTVVRAFNLTRVLTGRYAEANAETRKQGIRLVSWQGLVSAMNEFLGTGNFMAILGLGSYLIIKGEITPGDVMAATQLANGLVNPLRQLGDLWVGLQTSTAAADRVFAVLDEPAESLYPVSATPELGPESVISFNEVSFSYGERTALRDLTMHVPEGSVVALAGPSGGGKSTLFKLLLGFYQADSGQVAVHGRDVASYSLDELRQRIAFVPQESYLYDGTIMENIRLGRQDASQEEIIAAAQAANAHDFIMGLPQGYDTPVGERGAQLSGGQRQRISIARALLKDAPVLLLDEATSSLDSESEHLVQDALERLMQGRTTLVIAHRLSTIRNADCIHVVADGLVVEAGTHDELMELGGVYRKLHDMQLRDTAA